jgi:hypothetical protein
MVYDRVLPPLRRGMKLKVPEFLPRVLKGLEGVYIYLDWGTRKEWWDGWVWW